jgi:hypothetical protein
VEGKCAGRDALGNEAEHLDEVGWHTRAQHFFDAADALDALNDAADALDALNNDDAQ